MLARREFIESIGRFDPSAEPVEDWEYWLRGAKIGRFALSPRYRVLYRFTTGSASAAVERYQSAIERIVEREFATASPRLQARRRECLSNAKLHACLLYLTRTTAPEAHCRAGKLLFAAAALRPGLLASGRTVALIGAWLALALVPPRKVTRAALAMLRLYGRCESR